MKTIQFSWAMISGLGLALLILSKTIWNGLDPQGSYMDWPKRGSYVDWAGLGLINISRLLYGLGLGLGLIILSKTIAGP